MTGLGKKIQNEYMKDALGYSPDKNLIKKELEQAHKEDPKLVKKVMRDVFDKGVDPGIKYIEDQGDDINNLLIEIQKIYDDVKYEKIGKLVDLCLFFREGVKN